MSRIVNADRGAMFIANDVTGDYYCPSGFGVKSFSVRSDTQSLICHVARTHKTLMLEDAGSIDVLTDCYKEIAAYGSKSMILCPCVDASSGKVIAVLQLMNKKPASIARKLQTAKSDNNDSPASVPFSADDQGVIEAMAIEVSKVLKHVSLEAAYDSLLKDDTESSEQLASYISQYTHKSELHRNSSPSA